MTLLSSVTSDEIDGFGELLKKYGELLNNVTISPSIFLQSSIILLSAFIIRCIIWIKLTGTGDGYNHSSKIFVIAHVSLEALFSFLITYIIIKFTLADPKSYIINCIFAPGIGFFLSIIFDKKVLFKLEGAVKESSKKQDTSSSTSTTGNVINITNLVGTQQKQDEDKTETDRPSDYTLEFNDYSSYQENDTRKEKDALSREQSRKNFANARDYLADEHSKIDAALIKDSFNDSDVKDLIVKKINYLHDIDRVIVNELEDNKEKLNNDYNMLCKIADNLSRLSDNVDALKTDMEQSSYEQRRVRILRFDGELIQGKNPTFDEFQQVIYDIDKYESYCKAHPEFKNSLAKEAISHITDEWRDKRKSEEKKNRQKKESK